MCRQQPQAKREGNSLLGSRGDWINDSEEQGANIPKDVIEPSLSKNTF